MVTKRVAATPFSAMRVSRGHSTSHERKEHLPSPKEETRGRFYPRPTTGTRFDEASLFAGSFLSSRGILSTRLQPFRHRFWSATGVVGPCVARVARVERKRPWRWCTVLPVCARVHSEVSSSNKRKVALRDLLLLPRTHPPPLAFVVCSSSTVALLPSLFLSVSLPLSSSLCQTVGRVPPRLSFRFVSFRSCKQPEQQTSRGRVVASLRVDERRRHTGELRAHGADTKTNGRSIAEQKG